MMNLFLVLALSFIACLLLGIGYMIFDMYKSRRKASWTSTTTESPDTFAGGGGVAR